MKGVLIFGVLIIIISLGSCACERDCFDSDGGNDTNFSGVEQVLYNISNLNSYNNYPTFLWDSEEQIWKAWWCGVNNVNISIFLGGGFIDVGGDAIYYSTSLDKINWSSPIKVFEGEGGTHWDAQHTCDPSVIKNPNFAFNPNREYVMYYTGGVDDGVHGANVGIALSNNGVNWTRFHQIPLFENTSDGSYGYGHMSAVKIKNIDGAPDRFIFTYTKKTSTDVGVYTADSYDGFNFNAGSIKKLCLDSKFGGCFASPAVDIAFDQDNWRYIFTFTGFSVEWLYSASATWFGTIDGDPINFLGNYTYTNISEEGTSDGGGLFRTEDGYCPSGKIWSAFGDRDAHSNIFTQRLTGCIWDSSCGICSSGADSSGNSIVDIGELLTYISSWKSGSVSIGELLTAIGEWKNGC